MESLAVALMLLAVLGLLVSLVAIVVQAVRRKKKKPWILTLVVCFALIGAATVMAGRQPVSKTEKPSVTPKSEKPVEKKSQLSLNSDDILVDKRLYKGDLLIVTQCYAENKSGKDWEGSVNMKVYDVDGGVIYSSLEAAWTSFLIKAGDRDYLVAKIPYGRIRKVYSGNTIVVRWSWGSQKVEKRFKL